MIQYPLHFPVAVKGARGVQYAWSSLASIAAPQGELACAIPPEFEGPGGGFSPEDFFALAVANCFAATFQVIAEKSKVTVCGLNIDGTLTVDRDVQGRPCMKSMTLVVHADPGDSDIGRVQRVLEKTSQSCLVVHSIKTDVRFEFHVQPLTSGNL